MSNIDSRNDEPTIVVTTGEPAGVGPDLCASLAARKWPARLVLLGDREMLRQRAAALGASLAGLEIRHLPLAAPATPGRLDVRNASYVLAQLDAAIAGCLSGEFSALVTAPVHKGVINEAGAPFTGHTEYLAEKTGTRRVVMMLVGGGLRVALATTHLPLREVPTAITAPLIEDTLRVLVRDLRAHFGIEHPRVLVAGLNPHAGEGGHLGREEIEIIAPVLDRLRAEGFELVGPLPADTMFTPDVLAGSDAQLAMYHDQGLAVLKYAAFETGVNVTLGLPIVRTSVDHGTALSLAGTAKASPQSLFAAIELAIEMARRRQQRGKTKVSCEDRPAPVAAAAHERAPRP
ncbi:MAG: 4-hydroxythreonine-4-phosphate dehydrogenase PdxA [Rhodocyclaceae bacterium]|nr:4-hydroxythreonine-4-phosphate dehydrogenase PdxA [Rhodocyclaceae bacterium]